MWKEMRKGKPQTVPVAAFFFCTDVLFQEEQGEKYNSILETGSSTEINEHVGPLSPFVGVLNTLTRSSPSTGRADEPNSGWEKAEGTGKIIVLITTLLWNANTVKFLLLGSPQNVCWCVQKQMSIAVLQIVLHHFTY